MLFSIYTFSFIFKSVFVFNLHPLLIAFLDFQRGEGGRVLASIFIALIAVGLWKVVRRSMLAQSARRTIGDDGSPRMLQRTRERMNTLRNGIIGVAAILILGIWGSSIAGFAFSLAALAGGVLIVCKDFIQNILGLVMFSFTRPFRIGDHVQIDDVEGRVVDVGIMSFSLIQLGRGKHNAGTVVNVPTGLIVTHMVHNLSATGEFVMRGLDVCLFDVVDLVKAQDELLTAARLACADWMDIASNKIADFAHTEMVELADAHPQVFIDLHRAGEFRLSLRYPCRAHEHHQVEQLILRAYVAAMAQAGSPSKFGGVASSLVPGAPLLPTPAPI